MTATEKVTLAITNFVRGGDTSNTELLDQVLHRDFRVLSSNFMGAPGVTIIDKEGYLSKIREKVFGGLPREMTIEHIDADESIAAVKLRLKSGENDFVSWNQLLLDEDGNWKLISNLAIVKALAGE